MQWCSARWAVGSLPTRPRHCMYSLKRLSQRVFFSFFYDRTWLLLEVIAAEWRKLVEPGKDQSKLVRMLFSLAKVTFSDRDDHRYLAQFLKKGFTCKGKRQISLGQPNNEANKPIKNPEKSKFVRIPFVSPIAGSSRGSSFSMVGLLIPEIAKWSWCRLSCKLVSLHDSLWAALGCRCHLVLQACLHDSFWAALGCRSAAFPKLASLHDLHSGLRLAAAAALSPKLVSLHLLLLAAAAALSPKLISHLVSLPDYPFGLLLAAVAALSPSLSPFTISLLGCSWLLLPSSLPACPRFKNALC